MAPPAYVVHGLGVYYNLAVSRPRTMKSLAGELMRGRFRSTMNRRHWAVRGVSLTIHRGETFGIVGRNGSGKSTLLLTLAGIIPPDEGRMRVFGSPTLLTLGAGFDIELTGRQNIYLNGAYLGLSRAETTRLFDSIVDFSELGDFIDVPLRQYSTGMRARLGFSIVANVRPDILLLDEVLSVGDRPFQEKSKARLRELMEHAGAMVVVSHDLAFLEQLCTQVAWMKDGRLEAIGDAAEVLEAYRAYGASHDAEAMRVTGRTEPSALR